MQEDLKIIDLIINVIRGPDSGTTALYRYANNIYTINDICYIKWLNPTKIPTKNDFSIYS